MDGSGRIALIGVGAATRLLAQLAAQAPRPQGVKASRPKQALGCRASGIRAGARHQQQPVTGRPRKLVSARRTSSAFAFLGSRNSILSFSRSLSSFRFLPHALSGVSALCLRSWSGPAFRNHPIAIGQ